MSSFRKERKMRKMHGLMMMEKNILLQDLETEIFQIKNGRRYIIVILNQRTIKAH